MPDAPVAVEAKPSLFSIIIGAVMSGTGRRLIVFLLGFMTVALNKKLALDLDPNSIYGGLALILGYIFQSAAKEASDAHADAKMAGAMAAAAPSAELNK